MRIFSALLVAQLAALLALAGCGGDDDADSASDEPTSPSAPATQDGGCPWIGQQAVADALGGDVEVVAAGPGGCSFAATTGEITVSVTPTPIAIDLEEYATGSREQCDSEVTEVEAGEFAFACVAFGPQGFVYAGSDSVVIGVENAADDATGVALAAAMLPSVVL